MLSPILTLVALLLVDDPKGLVVTRESVKVEKVYWFDTEGKRWVTKEPYLVMRLQVHNQSDHTIRWPGLSKASVTYGKHMRSNVLLAPPFEKGARFEDSLVADEEIKSTHVRNLTIVFPVPRERGSASLLLQWKGEHPGYVVTVKQGFKLPDE